MATQPLIQPKMSVDEYLATVFRPDCDYVDGEVQERNLGERDHSFVQKRLIQFLSNREPQWGIEVYPEQRVQISATRFRIPDVAVVLGRSEEQILRTPPFLCIEVLSPEDRISRVRERVQDYLNMGVPHVWVLDPHDKSAFAITPAEGWREVKDGVLRTADPAFEVLLTEIFA
jgi:Uma2 family endonuclease